MNNITRAHKDLYIEKFLPEKVHGLLRLILICILGSVGILHVVDYALNNFKLYTSPDGINYTEVTAINWPVQFTASR